MCPVSMRRNAWWSRMVEPRAILWLDTTQTCCSGSSISCVGSLCVVALAWFHAQFACLLPRMATSPNHQEHEKRRMGAHQKHKEVPSSLAAGDAAEEGAPAAHVCASPLRAAAVLSLLQRHSSEPGADVIVPFLGLAVDAGDHTTAATLLGEADCVELSAYIHPRDATAPFLPADEVHRLMLQIMSGTTLLVPIHIEHRTRVCCHFFMVDRSSCRSLPMLCSLADMETVAWRCAPQQPSHPPTHAHIFDSTGVDFLHRHGVAHYHITAESVVITPARDARITNFDVAGVFPTGAACNTGLAPPRRRRTSWSRDHGPTAGYSAPEVRVGLCMCLCVVCCVAVERTARVPFG